MKKSSKSRLQIAQNLYYNISSRKKTKRKDEKKMTKYNNCTAINYNITYILISTSIITQTIPIDIHLVNRKN